MVAFLAGAFLAVAFLTGAFLAGALFAVAFLAGAFAATAARSAETPLGVPPPEAGTQVAVAPSPSVASTRAVAPTTPSRVTAVRRSAGGVVPPSTPVSRQPPPLSTRTDTPPAAGSGTTG